MGSGRLRDDKEIDNGVNDTAGSKNPEDEDSSGEGGVGEDVEEAEAKEGEDVLVVGETVGVMESVGACVGWDVGPVVGWSVDVFPRIPISPIIILFMLIGRYIIKLEYVTSGLGLWYIIAHARLSMARQVTFVSLLLF